MHWPYWNNFKRVIVYSSDSWEEAEGCTIPTAGRWLPSETQKCLGMGKGLQRAAPSLFMENWSCFTWWDGWISAAIPVPRAWWPSVRSPNEPFVNHCSQPQAKWISKKRWGELVKKKKKKGQREEGKTIQLPNSACFPFHFYSSFNY